MLDVQSPIPLTEGESLVFGVTTKHAVHFVIGLLVSSPVAGIVAVCSPLFHLSPWSGILVSFLLGGAFAVVPFKGRTLSEIGWLSVRYAMRPKTLLYDRYDRIAAHRWEESAR
ncbi:MAG: hypothetical protein OWT28_02560 [Firmicutes bacterium]|nr:hypothetical protein [Bacillota bacterium]